MFHFGLEDVLKPPVGRLNFIQGLSEIMVIMNIKKYIFFLTIIDRNMIFRTTIDVVFDDYSLFAFSSLRIMRRLL